MRIKVAAPAILISAVCVILSGLSIVSLNLSTRITDASEDSMFQLMKTILSFNLKNAEAKALARAELVASMTSVKSIFAAQDRSKLLAETELMYKTQVEKYGLDQAQFHIPPSISFLRLNAPDKFGDDLSSFRPIVADVHRNKETRKGVSVSRSGPGIFGVVPVKDDKGNFLGSFEMGLDFGPIFDGLKSAYGYEIALFVEEKILRDVATSMSSDILNDKNRLGPYMRIYASHTDLLSSLIDKNDVGQSEDKRDVREAFKTPYGISFIPLYNYVNKQIGTIAIAQNFSGTRSSKGQIIVWQWTFTLFAVVLIAGLILIVINGSVMKPLYELGKRLSLAASGEQVDLKDDFSACCEEIATIAKCCDMLQKKE